MFIYAYISIYISATVPPVGHQWSVSSQGTFPPVLQSWNLLREHRGHFQSSRDTLRSLRPLNFCSIFSSSRMAPKSHQNLPKGIPKGTLWAPFSVILELQVEM